MPAPDNPNIARVAMIFARDTRTFVNTFHVVNPTPWTPSDLPDLALLFRDWWNTSYRVLAMPAVALTQVQVRVYDPDNPYAYDLAVNPPIAGTYGNGVIAAANDALSVSWRTGLAGRKYRGRFFTVGVSDAAIDDLDRMISSYVTSAGVAAGSILANVLAAGFSLVIFHRIDNTFTVILSTVIENIIDSQRRRLPGRGR